MQWIRLIQWRIVGHYSNQKVEKHWLLMVVIYCALGGEFSSISVALSAETPMGWQDETLFCQHLWCTIPLLIWVPGKHTTISHHSSHRQVCRLHLLKAKLDFILQMPWITSNVSQTHFKKQHLVILYVIKSKTFKTVKTLCLKLVCSHAQVYMGFLKHLKIDKDAASQNSLAVCSICLCGFSNWPMFPLKPEQTKPMGFDDGLISSHAARPHHLVHALAVTRTVCKWLSFPQWMVYQCTGW